MKGLALVLMIVAVPKKAPPPPVNPSSEPPEAWLNAAVGKPGGLKSDEVAGRAVAASLAVQQKNEDLNAAGAVVGQAIVGYFPRVLGTARYTRLSPMDPQTLGSVVVAPMANDGPLGPMTLLVKAPVEIEMKPDQTVFTATLLVPVSDYFLKISQGHFAAAAARDAAAHQANAAKLQVALDARLLYYGWARAHLQAIVADQALQQTKAHKALADRMFDAQALSKADVMRVDAQVAAAELFLAKVKTAEAVLSEQLRVVMRDPAAGPFEIGDDLTTPLPASTIPERAALLDQAKGRRLEVKALDRTVDGLSSQAWAARSGYLPHVDGVANVQYANPNSRFFPPKYSFETTWDVSVQVSWSPNEIALATQATDVVRAKRRQAELTREQLFDLLKIELAQSSESLREADLSVETTRRGLAAAEESYRVRRELFQNERSTSTELTEAETFLTQARLNAVGARIDQRVARARLDHAVGEDVP